MGDERQNIIDSLHSELEREQAERRGLLRHAGERERRIKSLEKENERLADTLIQDHDRYKGHIERLEAALRRVEDIARPWRDGVHGKDFGAIVREVRQALEHQGDVPLITAERGVPEGDRIAPLDDESLKHKRW